MHRCHQPFRHMLMQSLGRVHDQNDFLFNVGVVLHIGDRGHKWKYNAGEWTEKKVTPDKWEFRYAVTKRRAGKAPEGSGVPLGTEYHWYILADQTVKKLDANSYSTEMFGMKYKLAHKRADKNSWSASDRAKRKRLIQLLQEMISELQKEPLETKVEPTVRAAPKRKVRAAPKRTPARAKKQPARSRQHAAAA